MATFGPKPWVNPFGIHVGEHISLGICVSQVGEHISQWRCVSQVGKHISLGKWFLRWGNTYLQGYVFPRWETHITRDGPKPWVNLFGIHVGEHISLRICVSQVREHISQGRCVSQVRKHISLGKWFLRWGNTYHQGYVFLKKKSEKWPLLDQNHGLIPLEKCQFFDFLTFFFLYPRKAFFRSRIS